MKKSIVLATAVASILASGVAAAGSVSANVGVVSEYYYRGIVQSDASANGGFDYDYGNGVAVGVWASDVGGMGAGDAAAGIEYDLYGSYSGDMDGFGYSVGYTAYLYTGDFDTSYGEVNLGGTYGDLGVDVAVGSHEVVGGTDEDYTFVAVSYGSGPFSATYGTFSGDWGGSYLELGVSTDIGGADVGLSLLNGDPDGGAVAVDTSNGTAMVLSISKGFDL